jgi:hypothetical protein
MIMENLIKLLFILCMGSSLCVLVCSMDLNIQLIAAVLYLLSAFALAVTHKLVTNK